MVRGSKAFLPNNNMFLALQKHRTPPQIVDQYVLLLRIPLDSTPFCRCNLKGGEGPKSLHATATFSKTHGQNDEYENYRSLGLYNVLGPGLGGRMWNDTSVLPAFKVYETSPLRAMDPSFCFRKGQRGLDMEIADLAISPEKYSSVISKIVSTLELIPLLTLLHKGLGHQAVFFLQFVLLCRGLTCVKVLKIWTTPALFDLK